MASCTNACKRKLCSQVACDAGSIHKPDSLHRFGVGSECCGASCENQKGCPRNYQLKEGRDKIYDDGHLSCCEPISMKVDELDDKVDELDDKVDKLTNLVKDLATKVNNVQP